MLSLFNWVYELGIKHERNRIKLLIANHRKERPNAATWEYEQMGPSKKKRYEHDVALWSEVNGELEKLLDPFSGQTDYIERIALIDQD